MIAALYVETHGIYRGMQGVSVWDIVRDARRYDGPYPVVAHPPCARWGQYADGPPLARGTRTPGDDKGCFAAALASVRQWGGVLEHPANSKAWAAFGLPSPPVAGGWMLADGHGGWTCHVEQGWYGHRARKATWLYACVPTPPLLRWGKSPPAPDVSGMDTATRRRRIKTGICQRLSHKQRAATPHEFRDLLLSIAATAKAPA